MRKHKTPKQEEIFLKFMKNNPDLAKGFTKGNRASMEVKWTNLTNDLNAVGPPVKDVAGWKKVWSDWRVTVRKKLSREIKSTGVGSSSQIVILPMEEEIAGICGFLELVDGVLQFDVQNTQEAKQVDDSSQSSVVEIDTDDSMPEPTKKKVRRTTPQNFEILCTAQTEVMKSIVDKLDILIAQQSEHYRSIENIEREKLQVLKSLYI